MTGEDALVGGSGTKGGVLMPRKGSGIPFDLFDQLGQLNEEEGSREAGYGSAAGGEKAYGSFGECDRFSLAARNESRSSLSLAIWWSISENPGMMRRMNMWCASYSGCVRRDKCRRLVLTIGYGGVKGG